MAAGTPHDRLASGGPRVAFACAVWSDLTRPPKPAFCSAVVGTYKAEASTVTRNLIDSGLPLGSINPATTWVMLGNAMYFKGKWEGQPFNRRLHTLIQALDLKAKRHTAHKPFRWLDRIQVNVPFMQSFKSLFVAVHDGFKVLKLRYKMEELDHEGTTLEHAPLPPLGHGDHGAHGHGAPYAHRHVSAAYNDGGPSPNYLPTGPSPYFRHHRQDPPPWAGITFSSCAHPRPYPYGALGRFGYLPNPSYALQVPFGRVGLIGHPRNPYFPRHNAFCNSYAPDPWTGNAYPSQGAASWAHSSSDHTGYMQFSMCIFLQDAHDVPWGLLDTMASQPGFLHDHLPEQRIALHEFRILKFKLSFHSSIAAVLKKLGLELSFCQQGNLSDMVEDDGSGLPIVVDDVIHKAIVEVNEEGTEAAAVTMVVQGLGCTMPSPPTPPHVDFIADHPFAYYSLLEEATGAVVFAGHVLDPTRSNK
ncbi:hypothetical protein VPH35_027802 [Triticum aestivum]